MAIEIVVIGAIGAQKYQFVDFGSFGVQGNIVYLMPDNANNMIIKISKNNINDSLQHIDDTWNQLMPEMTLKRDFVDNLFYQAYKLFLGISAAIGTLSVFGFLIASIGLFGNATFITNIRHQEVGIRKVMGRKAVAGCYACCYWISAKPIFIANVFAWPVGYLIANTYVSMFATRTEFGRPAIYYELAVVSTDCRAGSALPVMEEAHECDRQWRCGTSRETGAMRAIRIVALTPD